MSALLTCFWKHCTQKSCRVLDAPDLVDDYYLNLMDWSSQNVVWFFATIGHLLILHHVHFSFHTIVHGMPLQLCSPKWLTSAYF